MSSTHYTWPYPEIVKLRAHRCGQWAKDIGGKTRYFGKVSDPKSALLKYQDFVRQQEAPTHLSPGLLDKSMGYLCNSYLRERVKDVKNETITSPTYADYVYASKLLIGHFGRAADVERLTPTDWDGFTHMLVSTKSPVTTARIIRKTKTIFKWALESEMIHRAPRYGPRFRSPPTKNKLANRKEGSSIFTRDEILRILDVAKEPVRTFVLLGINGGFGNTDCSELMVGDLDIERRMIYMRRHKTGILRIMPLWDETWEGILQATRKLDTLEGRVFLTKYGNPWVRSELKFKKDPEGNEHPSHHVNVDSINLRFGRVCKQIGIEGKSFYRLRHTFRTVAEGTRAVNQIKIIMGHALPGMDSVYLHPENIDLDDYREVTDYVRKWLFEG